MCSSWRKTNHCCQVQLLFFDELIFTGCDCFLGWEPCGCEEVQWRHHAHLHRWRRHGTCSNCSSQGTHTHTHAHTCITQWLLGPLLPLVTSLWLPAERVCSFGPVRADNSRVHRELFVDGGHWEPEGALALLRQLQRRRGGQHPRQRGRRLKRGERRHFKDPETQDSLCHRWRLSRVHWCPPPWRSWKTTAKTSSCPTRTWQQPECQATTRACWSPPSRWLASSCSR